jgi:hypothetical protein
MWVEELRIENVRSFDTETSLSFRQEGRPERPYKWVTFLSENGGGKSTALQALGLLLAGPEAAQKLLPRPIGWLRDESKLGKISTRIHKDISESGSSFGTEKKRNAFGYSYSITGTERVKLSGKLFTEPSIVPSGQYVLSWLRGNAFPSNANGWFAVGYGAFRRLTRSSQIIVPSLDPPARFTNFSTQFDEAEPLSAFERWMVYLDYRIAKENDAIAKHRKDMGVAAINRMLPDNSRFDSVTGEGRILFNVEGSTVPTIALSDGYRSILALGGDLVWRLIQAFPKSQEPLKESGVVLIDELDIHLHPMWQREIPIRLRELFPNLQFIVATHSPLVAAGAGEDALTLRFKFDHGKSIVDQVQNLAALNVDRILQSEAFGVVSPYSPPTQRKIERYDELVRKPRKSKREQDEYTELMDFMKEARPLGGPPEPGSLNEKVEAFLEKKLI